MASVAVAVTAISLIFLLELVLGILLGLGIGGIRMRDGSGRRGGGRGPTSGYRGIWAVCGRGPTSGYRGIWAVCGRGGVTRP